MTRHADQRSSHVLSSDVELSASTRPDAHEQVAVASEQVGNRRHATSQKLDAASAVPMDVAIPGSSPQLPTILQSLAQVQFWVTCACVIMMAFALNRARAIWVHDADDNFQAKDVSVVAGALTPTWCE